MHRSGGHVEGWGRQFSGWVVAIMMSKPAPVYSIVLAVSLILAGCGGGGGGGAVRPEPQGPQPSPPPQTTPPPSSLPPLPPPPPSCIQTADYGCISREKYEEELDAIAQDHSGEEDFKNQWGLTAIRADRAWAQLELKHGAGSEPGSGITVGLIDTGIDTDHPLFTGKTLTEHLFAGATQETGDTRSHGTAVAGVIAARSLSDTFTDEVTAPRGVAPGADIAMFAIRAGSGGGNYVPISPAGLGGTDEGWADKLSHVINWSSGGRSLDFVNMSVGFQGIIEQYGEQQLRGNFEDAITALAQEGSTEKTVFVWAAGNAYGDPCDASDFASSPDLCVNGSVVARSVEILPGLPARIAELRGYVVAVVAVAPDSDADGDYEIASFSNRCGIAAQWCLAAPGAGIRAAYFGRDPDDDTPGARGTYTASGTSFAAPMVTGGLAVMKDYFRGQLSNTALVTRLLDTADKDGVYADSSTYGQGMLDLAAATSPVGDPGVVLGERVGSAGNSLRRTRFALGTALGDGLTHSLAGQELVAFDDLNAPFWFALGDLTGAAPGPSVAARLRGLMAPPPLAREPGTRRPLFGGLAADDWGAGFDRLRPGFLAEPSAGVDSGHLSLAARAPAVSTTWPAGLGFAAFSTEGMRRPVPVSGALLSWRPSDLPIGVHGGLVAERETLLRSRAAGAFGRFSASSFFTGIEGSARIGGWRFDAGAEIGMAGAAARDGMVAGVSPLFNSAFAIQAQRPLADEGSLMLSVSQPLRVESGQREALGSRGPHQDGRVLRQSVAAGLEPSGRQLDIAAQWRRPLPVGGELRLRATWTRQPGHAATADTDFSVLAGWRRAF